MSGALMGVSVFAGVGQQALAATGLTPAFIRAPRSIGTIIPDVTIEEHFSDRAQVTMHPLSDIKKVPDHMFLQPKTVVMRCGWSNSNIVGGLVEAGVGAVAGGTSLLDTGTNVLGLFTEQRCKQVYERLLALQASRQPFRLTTGKRSYPKSTAGSLQQMLGNNLTSLFTTGSNSAGTSSDGQMVITELSATTDRTTEYALIIEVHLQEVLLVDLANTGPQPQEQARPETTAAPANGGTQEPVRVPQGIILPGLGFTPQYSKPAP